LIQVEPGHTGVTLPRKGSFLVSTVAVKRYWNESLRERFDGAKVPQGKKLYNTD
jgi:hypothetical protein